QDMAEIVEQALEAGFSHLDTAAIYANEQFVGKATRESGLGREDVWATTKYDDGVVSEEVHSIGITHPDPYLVHGLWSIETMTLRRLLEEMNKVKHAGLAKSIGVSNFILDLLQRTIKTGKRVPAVKQIRLHLYNYASWKDVLEFSAKRGIVTEAYGSLASITTSPGGLIDPTLARIAARIGGTSAQVIFTWAHSMGGTPDETSTYASFN
ncbi:NADP-dependent oxidoreductase domain-containing protein, partial [Multifurca ochricompacta]